jgi:hypothetical protein
LPDLNTAAIVPRHKIAVRAKAKLLELYLFHRVDLLHLGTATWAKQCSHKGQSFNRSMSA